MARWQLWRRPAAVIAIILGLAAVAGGLLLSTVLVATWSMTPLDVALLVVCVLAQPGQALLSRRFGRLSTTDKEVTCDLLELSAVPCVVLLPLHVSLPAIAAMLVIHELITSRSGWRLDTPHQTLFNVSQHVVGWYAARQIFDLISSSAQLGSTQGVLALAALLSTHLLVTWLLVCPVLVGLGQADVREMVQAFVRSLPGNAAAGSSGVLLTVCWLVHPLTVIAIVPLLAALQQSVAYAHLLDQARRDAKTGLVNAERWRVVAEGVMARAHTGNAPVSVLIVDLDHFKNINDTYGHLAGDDVIREVALRLQRSVRPTDVVGRFGGEEFVVLLSDTTRSDAAVVAERCRSAVAGLPIAAATSLIAVTASVGAATAYPGIVTLSELMEHADVALYEAKAAGRDRVVVAGAARTEV